MTTNFSEHPRQNIMLIEEAETRKHSEESKNSKTQKIKVPDAISKNDDINS